MGADSIIYIRTDGNSKIATGHFVRCLCIAEALEALGKKICFLVSDEESAALLQDLTIALFKDCSFSFDVKVLKTAAYDNLELELDELICLLDLGGDKGKREYHDKCNEDICHKPTIFTDSYFVTEKYLTSVSRFAQIAYMDDIRAFDYPVDLLINYDVIPFSKEVSYRESYKNAKKTLLGAQFTPLRKQFQNQKITVKKQIQNILITSGGSDPYQFTNTLITYFMEKKLKFQFHIVVGRLFSNVEELEKIASKNSNIHLHCNVSDMAGLMKQCDFAVSAAGTTLYELCALGIPAISFSMADNQIPMAETFAEVGAVPYAGDIRVLETQQKEKILNCISEYLLFLHENANEYRKQQKNMNGLVDGNGAVKIAEELCKL